MTRLKSAFCFKLEKKGIDVTRRKYRVLDDCARLREVIETFPDDRHFIPSVLFILWNEDDSETLADDLRHMVRCIAM
jgi:nuclear mRNA export protein SAC3